MACGKYRRLKLRTIVIWKMEEGGELTKLTPYMVVLLQVRSAPVMETVEEILSKHDFQSSQISINIDWL
uniref:Uncharacterized protein n=1 Tax=Arion vulgaris TaxID=1028688 RepID=A0A0B7BWB8_9EUPU